MKGKFLTFLALGICVSILALPLLAHHGNAAYDTEKKITVKGTVVQWLWANPHCVLQFDAENATTMTHSGWSKQSFKPGDEVTVTMITVKNGKPIGRIVEAVLPNGQKLAGRVIPALPSSRPEDYPRQ